MKNDFEFFHDIVITIENVMKSNKIKYNISQELQCTQKCNECTRCTKPNDKDERIMLAYLNSLRKSSTPHSREIYYSEELSSKRTSLPSDTVCSLSYFESLFKNGDEIKYHLSRGIFDGCRQDILLNSWNITHIHLNTRESLSKSSMKKSRADYLLFCIVQESKVFFIDVIPHPKSPSGFLCFGFLQIIYNNGWMKEIGFAEVEDAKDVSPKITDEETLYSFLQIGNLMFELNNHVFCPIGVGVATSGHSLMDVSRMNNFCNEIRKIRSKSDSCKYIIPDDYNNDLGKIEVKIGDKSYSLVISMDLTLKNL